MNSGVSWPEPSQATARVLGIQRKLHKWAKDDRARRFSDLHNLVCDYQSSLAAATLRRFGIDATDVVGGAQAWLNAGLPVERAG